MPTSSPIVLIVLDGWGLRPEKENNAIALARTPVYDGLLKRYPHAQLITSGEAVGLPAGQMGNSEVGHMNMGAGRIVYQDLTRIDKSIRDGESVREPRACGGDGSLRRRATRASLHRAALGRRCPQQSAASARPRRNGGQAPCPSRVRPRHHRRARHFAHRRRPVPVATAGRPRSSVHRPRRDDLRALLRDGSRQALGADQAGLRRDRQRDRGTDDAVADRGCSGLGTKLASPTSSSNPSSS